MPESDGSLLLLFLLGTCLVLLVVVVALLVRISSRLTRLETQAQQPVRTHEPADESPTAAESSPGGAFEVFLGEDPARRELSKAEQFSAFRKWRQEKGMNWSNS